MCTYDSDECGFATCDTVLRQYSSCSCKNFDPEIWLLFINVLGFHWYDYKEHPSSV